MRIVGSNEMREIDRIATQELGVPALALMIRAGRVTADAAMSMMAPNGRVLVVCGAGNNGGDGFALARILRSAGRDVRVVALAPSEGMSPVARVMRQEANEVDVPIADATAVSAMGAEPGDVVVDAVFGVGLSRPPEGVYAAAIARMQELRERGARVLSVDIPSGLSADTGHPMERAVRADRTVALAFQKKGLVVYPGAEYAGEVSVADIGMPAAAAARVPVTAEVLTEAEARTLVPVRGLEAHKGDAGRVLVVAGSPGKTGAAHLALRGALRGGAGLVTLAARPEVMPFALVGVPEAMNHPLPGQGPLGRSDLAELVAAAKDADSIVIGPGIPRGPETGPLIRDLLERAQLPAVLDADALNAFAEHPGLVASVARWAPVVMTPHPGEMARLLGTSVEEVQADRLEVAQRKSREWGAVVILKGARTVVADPDSVPAVILTGNPGMATGGTGDVLAGLAGALLGSHLPIRDAARAAAWVHGRAGDLAARRLGQRGLAAGDVAEALGAVWVEWGR
ncbi:MAG TPA: NAD(P)H-hydrate dehydratase [Anaeromyxobacteraceae bacterium]|nr:NAD(P)H-hydrate dehydratase [Anaeromyxobacteraceae bacterium]